MPLFPFFCDVSPHDGSAATNPRLSLDDLTISRRVLITGGGTREGKTEEMTLNESFGERRETSGKKNEEEEKKDGGEETSKKKGPRVYSEEEK